MFNLGVRNIKPKISIIVPVYNVEKLIIRCIESILGQSFTDLELILINDGSIDNSGSICEEYALKDTRINVIHIENDGVSNARNIGIKIAKGDYIMFCDSDDYVEQNWCIDLYEAVVRFGNVLPICGVRIVNNLKKEKLGFVREFTKNELFSNKSYFEIYKKGLSASLWCKIYKRNVIIENSIFFDVNVNRGEDLLFNLTYIRYVDSIVTIPKIGYNYVHSNGNSLVNSYRKNLSEINNMVYYAWQEYFKQVQVDREQLVEFSTYFYLNFLEMFKNTFDKRNKDHLFKKLIYNNRILNSSEFLECIEMADTKKEDQRYIKLLKSKNYYLVWLVEQFLNTKQFLIRKKMINN